ncbi:hypothetical protein FB446DRAFT_705676 [Lentinula raphanica]|nr:hypothetical protein FB446DRAFT_705676 [Lentinula raphanica]
MSSRSNTRLPDVITLCPPKCGYEDAEVVTVVRNNIMLYNHAPHGYYLTPKTQGGKQYIFKFVKGQDAMKAYNDCLQSQSTFNMSSKYNKPSLSPNRAFNPLPMRTGQQSYTSNSRSNYSPQIQFQSRMADPDNATSSMRPNPVTRYSQNTDNNALLPLEGIRISDDMNPAEIKVYYYVIAYVDDTNPQTKETKFHLPIDTDFKYFHKEENSSSSEIIDWPEDFNKNLSHLRWPHMVNHPNISQWNTQRQTLKYSGGAYFGVGVILNGWDWYKGEDSERGFKIYNGFDFAVAADKKIVSENYDGNIGLAPKHQNILSFGPWFPFQLPSNPEANFSPPIPAISDNDSRRPETWTFKLLRIGISVNSGGSNNFSWINMDNSATNSSRVDQGINVTIDTGSPFAVLPDYVISKILSDDNWLGLSTRDTNGRLDITQTIYKKLNDQTICFEFQGEGTQLVPVYVQAYRFLLWYPTLGDQHRDPFYRCAIKGTQRKRSVLGQSFFWGAIVKHVNPTRMRKAPYVQIMPNGNFYDEKGNLVWQKDMVLKSSPPRFSN